MQQGITVHELHRKAHLLALQENIRDRHVQLTRVGRRSRCKRR
jgi:hypothetical protein